MAEKRPQWKRTWFPLLLGFGLLTTGVGRLLYSDGVRDDHWFFMASAIAQPFLGAAILAGGLIQWRRFGWSARAEPDGRSSMWNL